MTARDIQKEWNNKSDVEQMALGAVEDTFAPKGITQRPMDPMASGQVNQVKMPQMTENKPQPSNTDDTALKGKTNDTIQKEWNNKSDVEQMALGAVGNDNGVRTSEVQQRIADGEEPFLALVRKNKPQKDEDKEARLKKAGRLSAITNALATLAGGIPAIAGKSARGYAPTVQRSEEPFISRLNQLEEDYHQADKEYQQLETSARMQDLSRRLKLEDEQRAEERRQAEKKDEREYAKSLREDERAYNEQIRKQTLEEADEQREQQIADKKALTEYEVELGNMYSAIAEGKFEGSFEDWQELPADKRASIIKDTTDKQYAKALQTKATGRPSGSGKAVNTVTLDFGNGEVYDVPQSVLKSNASTLYNKMVKENANLAAPSVPTGKLGEDFKMLVREPNDDEKYNYLVNNIGKSPAAKKMLMDIVQNQGNVGLRGGNTNTSPDNTGTVTTENNDNFYGSYSGF